MNSRCKPERVFSHKPLRPVREDVLGEVVFMEHWLALMAKLPLISDDVDPPNEMFKLIMGDMPTDLTERHSRVCASMIRWLGTNNGRAFLEQADTLSIRLRTRSEGYLCAWAIENQRHHSSGWAWRTVEAVLSTKPLNDKFATRPELSVDDLEAVEVLVSWLGSEKGETFIVDVRKDIEKRLKGHRSVTK